MLFAECFKLARKQLCDTDASKRPPTSSGFSCNTCKVTLNTIYRFKDESYCKRCRYEIDSEDSEDSTTDGAFSD